MLGYDPERKEELAKQFRTEIDHQMRMIILEVEFYAFHVLHVDRVTIARIRDPEAGGDESKHAMEPCYAVDIVDDFDPEIRGKIINHAISCGAMPLPAVKDGVIHLEIPLHDSELWSLVSAMNAQKEGGA